MKNEISQLFVNANTKKPILQPSDNINQILSRDSFSFGFCQNKIERLLQNWGALVCAINDDTSQSGRRTENPKLVALGYTTEPINIDDSRQQQVTQYHRKTSTKRGHADTGSSQKVSALKKSRFALKHNHGSDPLEESRLAGKKLHEQLKEKKAANQNEDMEVEEAEKEKANNSTEALHGGGSDEGVEKDINDSDGEDEEDEDDGQSRPDLKTPPKPRSPRKKITRTSGSKSPVKYMPKNYDGPLPDRNIYNEDGRKVVKRHRWSNEEKEAVVQGVRKFGRGKWVQVKSAFPNRLRNRTAVQIKDCFRTMWNKNELPEDLMENKDDDAAQGGQGNGNEESD